MEWFLSFHARFKGPLNSSGEKESVVASAVGKKETLHVLEMRNQGDVALAHSRGHGWTELVTQTFWNSCIFAVEERGSGARVTQRSSEGGKGSLP